MIDWDATGSILSGLGTMLGVGAVKRLTFWATAYLLVGGDRVI